MRHKHVIGLRRPQVDGHGALLWETLRRSAANGTREDAATMESPRRTLRLPFETQCAAVTKTGRRCRGKIRNGTDFCPFHDPAITEERRRHNAAKGGRTPRRLSQLPGGYLRKLTNRQAVGHAMDRLYREIRLEQLTPEMGRVLFDILSRLLDSGFCDRQVERARPSSGRAKADRLRPKLNALLTNAERRAWKKAIENAPARLLQREVHPPQRRRELGRERAMGLGTEANPTPAAALALSAAS